MSEKGDTELAQALRLIVEWNPPQVESRGEMVPMRVAIGSKGERDYFRRIAQEAIAAHDTARAQPDELARSRVGLRGGRRVALEDMANTPETQQKLRDLLDLMERMEAHDKSKSIPPGCEPDEPKAARAQPASAADGWVMVPREPTEAMARAYDIYGIWVSRGYKAMLAAAPQPPAESGFFIGGPHATAIVHNLHHADRVIEALCECTGDDEDDYTVTDLSKPAKEQANDR